MAASDRRRQSVKVLGITGGVGAGKSTVLDYLQRRHGARVIQADRVAHLLQEPGGRCYAAICEEFGGEILREDGTIDRGRLGALVYAEPAKLARLNAIVHPSVKTYIIEEIEQERRAGRVPFVAVEAALLLEDHYDRICDEIWYVFADEETRAGRLARDRGYTPQKTRSVMANQLREEDYRRGCKFVIDNSGDFVENTYEQIDKGLVEHGFL